ncbi:hypothetical protein [Methanimicrococcus hacksteinii]|uniref:hypothetical protein n=1 Tax=Methanimicrococcus hacksteinii TaxID=3028293 RepID=UPI00298F08EE|nr:hypothetical protein [Methanimicrococcus sp. At1]
MHHLIFITSARYASVGTDYLTVSACHCYLTISACHCYLTVSACHCDLTVSAYRCCFTVSHVPPRASCLNFLKRQK